MVRTIQDTAARGRLLIAALALFLMVAAAPAPAAEPVSQEDRQAIRDVISSQMEAFRDDDWPRAFSYASPTIQGKFRDVETFRRMVVGGYPAVHRPREVRFERLDQKEGVIAQHVHLVGPDGAPAVAVYVMERQDDGSWRIAGVFMLASPDKLV